LNPPRRTRVLQSQRQPLPQPWLEDCLRSVRDWAGERGFEYHFIGNEFFGILPPGLQALADSQAVIASDLARLRWLQRYREGTGDRVLWLDADVLVFDPQAFELPDTACAVGREVWIDYDRRGRIKAWRKVHNAFLMFAEGDSLLDFYADSAERLLRLNPGPKPPQFIGPKLLTALHSLSAFPVLESAALFSPLLLRDLLGEPEAAGAIECFEKHSADPPAAVNLCSSSIERGDLDNPRMQQAIERLLQQRGLRPR